MSTFLENDYLRLLEHVRHSRDELDHLVRALSHDMTANFMLLDNSFARLKRLLHTASPEEVDRSVAHVEACLCESKRFLDDMVLLARTGGVHMEPARVNLDELLDEVLFEHREQITARRVDVDVHRPLGIVWCNPRRVKQILTNLIGNALKHGCDPVQPTITVTSQTDSAPTRPMLVLCVHDNGAGIAPQSHDDIFLPGHRLAQAAADGSGMGLAIVRKIAEQYGGSVRVDADCPAGTAIVLQLPAPTGEPLPQPHYEPRPSATPLKSHHHQAATPPPARRRRATPRFPP